MKEIKLINKKPDILCAYCKIKNGIKTLYVRYTNGQVKVTQEDINRKKN